jgi:hypothetical protein
VAVGGAIVCATEKKSHAGVQANVRLWPAKWVPSGFAERFALIWHLSVEQQTLWFSELLFFAGSVFRVLLFQAYILFCPTDDMD